MAVRFRGYGTSLISDTDYVVEIWDADWAGSSTDIEIGPSIFELTYLKQGDERYTPIKGSECKVELMITNDTPGNNLVSWINSSLYTKNEDKNHIVIRQGAGLDVIWAGVILPDLNSFEDASRPYSYIITATDGLARLENIEYEEAVDTALNLSTGRVPFNVLIWEILNRTPLYQLNLGNILFTTAVDWYENQMPAKASTIDPINYTKISRYTFAIQEENTDDVGMSCYDVLEKICEQWNVRIMLSGGVFRIYQPNVYENGGTAYYERAYLLSNGGFDYGTTFSGYNVTLSNTARPYTLAGNQWEFFPALRLVELNYPYSNPNMLNANAEMSYIAGVSFIYGQDLRDSVLGGTNRYFNFNIALNYELISLFSTPPVAGGFTAYIAVYLKIGSYYLKKNILPAGGASWTTNSADRYYIQVKGLSVGKNQIAEIAIQTPQIPGGVHDANEFSISAYSVYEMGFPLTAGTNYATEIIKGTPFLLYSDSTQNGDSFSSYIVANSTPYVNSKDLFLPDAIIGEMYDQSNPGNLYIYDGAVWRRSTSTWRFNDTGTAYDMNMMRCIDIMAGQRNPVKKYQGGIIGYELDPHSSFTYDSQIYILNGGTYNGGTETWQGEWFVVAVDRTAIDVVRDTWQPGSGIKNTELSRRIGGLSEVVGNLGYLADRVYFSPFSASATLEPISQVVGSSTTSTLTLPHAADANPSGYSSIKITICNTATTTNPTLTVASQDSAIISGEGTSTNIIKGQSATFVTDGVNWFII